MSDAIREAFEALDWLAKEAERAATHVHDCEEGSFQAIYDRCGAIRATLQSQTAPAPPSVAVPGPVAALVQELRCRCDPLNPCWNNRPDDVPGEHWGGGDACAVCKAKAALTAAPAPDHIADTGKVVPGLSFRALREANAERINSSKYEQCERHWTPAHWMQATVGELGELANLLKKVDRGDFPFDQVKDDVARELADVQTYLDILALKLGVDLGQATIDKFNEVSERIGSHVTLTATPSVPEEEVKARALEEYADQLDVVFANAQEAGANDCPAWHAGQFAKDARKQAARLRTAGDDGEGRS